MKNRSRTPIAIFKNRPEEDAHDDKGSEDIERLPRGDGESQADDQSDRNQQRDDRQNADPEVEQPFPDRHRQADDAQSRPLGRILAQSDPEDDVENERVKEESENYQRRLAGLFMGVPKGYRRPCVVS